jgi:hypothetical protein
MANNMQSSVHLMKQLRAYGTLVPLGTAALHAGLFASTVIYVYTSSQAQAALVWAYWVVPDFPISLLHQ